MKVYEHCEEGHDCSEGLGIYWYSRTDKQWRLFYAGDFAKGEKHGLGEMHWHHGEHYVGQYSHGKRHGLGYYKDAYGEKYEGEWDHGERHGYGKAITLHGYFWQTTSVRVGKWEHDHFVEAAEEKALDTNEPPTPTQTPSPFSHTWCSLRWPSSGRMPQRRRTRSGTRSKPATRSI